ncbi:hypothetical protein [Gallaecimonas sp. GXIMD4217]|uniref:hypothetical protein n=1 Tax=Gallaecimonas sp. GXIMD4217 TaxID=3131927 RepID=UPI00311B0A57
MFRALIALLAATSAQAELHTPSCAGRGYPAAYPSDEIVDTLKAGMKQLAGSPLHQAIADGGGEDTVAYINFLSEGFCRAGYDYWATFELVYRDQQYGEEIPHPDSGEFIESHLWYPLHGIFMPAFFAATRAEFRQELRQKGWLSEDFYFLSELE